MRIFKHAEQGFTLIETVVAVAIIATGFFALYSLHLQTIAVSNTVRFYIKAPLLAQEKIAELETRLEDMRDSDGDFGEDYTGYTYKMTIEESDHEMLGETAKNVRKITLQVVLNDGEETYDLTEYRYLADED